MPQAYQKRVEKRQKWAAKTQQMGLFEHLKRWPRRPYCTDDLETGLRVRPLPQAIQKIYLQANPPQMLTWLIFDIDRPNAGMAWHDANLPPPTWSAVNRDNGHAHLAWGLTVPVMVDGMGARDAPIRFACAVQSLMRTMLGADIGYSGLITKNPEHDKWRTWRGPQLTYKLSELAEWLPGLEQHFPKRREPELVGLGRNVTLFDKLRKWAYKAIRPYWGRGLDGWNAWLSHCNSRALVYNADFPVLLDVREVWHVARSVAKWTFRRTTAKGYSNWRSAQGRRGAAKSAKVRRLASEDKRASARLMRDQGMSSRQIAAEIHVNQSTVVRWLKG